MSRHGPWAVLGIEPTEDIKSIRRAYAEKLKAMDVDREAAKYAQLRDARDHALHLARSMAAPPESVEDEDEWSLDFAASGQMGAGEFDRDARWSSPAGPDAGAIAPEPLQPAEPGPDILLQQLLFPGGQHSDEGFAYEEYEAAQGHMRQIVADALEGELGLQRMSDYWLADRLAAAWPRSAPLVIEAAEAFEWERQAGMLGEGAAQAFLNARLRGMRFHAKAQQPDHWAHKAWEELSRPGPKRWFERSKAGPADVRKLIGGIREHFPEVETFLDAERVSSWEKKSGDNPWRVAGPILIGVLLLFRVIAMFAPDPADDVIYRVPPPIVEPEVLEQRAREAIVEQVFGRGTTYEELESHAPDIAKLVGRHARIAKDKGGIDIAANEVGDTIRQLVLIADDKVDFEALMRIKQLKRDLAALALEQSGSAGCMAMLAEGRLFPSVAEPPEIRQREREIAAALVKEGLLQFPDGKSDAIRTIIPGAIFDAAVRKSGLTREMAQAAALDEGTEADRCAFHLALMGEVLRQPGKVSGDLLRLL